MNIAQHSWPTTIINLLFPLGSQVRAQLLMSDVRMERKIQQVVCGYELDIPAVDARCAGLAIPRELISTDLIDALLIRNRSHTLLIFTPKAKPDINDWNYFNQSLDASLTLGVESWASERGVKEMEQLDFDSFLLLPSSLEHIYARELTLPLREVRATKTINSIKALYDYVLKLHQGDVFAPGPHLRTFAWIYYIELKVVQAKLANLNKICLHDIATNTANFPLLLASTNLLEVMGLEKLNIDIACSDLEVSIPKSTVDMFTERQPLQKSISLHSINILQEDDVLNQADVIIANDVLEHFDEVAVTLALQSLWKQTKKYLLIHVPIEIVASTKYGHLTIFTREKLDSMAACLDSCKNVTSEFSNDINLSGLQGFLFLQRVTD